MKNNKKKLISLFSGCGGMDLGFEGGFNVFSDSVNYSIKPQWRNPIASNNNQVLLPETSFETFFANDIRQGAKDVWENYFSKYARENRFFLKSIVDIVKSEKNYPNIFPENVDVVTGGFPCQDFSIAGKRKGFSSHKNHNGLLFTENEESTIENRGMLYTWMKEVINITKPKVFIAENVKGLISLSNVKEIIENDFRSIADGYVVIPATVLHAGEYGIPQSRERIFFIGLSKAHLKPEICKELLSIKNIEHISSEINPYPPKTHKLHRNADLFDEELNAYVPVSKVLENLDEPENTHDPSQKYFSKAKWFGRHCQGQIEINPSKLGPTIRSEHHGNIEFRRLSEEHGGKFFLDEIAMGKLERRLTLRECARIQTFPDNFDFVIENANKKNSFLVSPSEAYKLVGNAVPPLLAYHLASRLDEVWNTLFQL